MSRQQWLQNIPLLYRFYTQVDLSAIFSQISACSWVILRRCRQTFKFNEAQAYVVGRDHQNRGLFALYYVIIISIVKISVPKLTELDDDRVKLHMELRFKAKLNSQITLLEEMVKSRQWKESNDLVALCEREEKQIGIYSRPLQTASNLNLLTKLKGKEFPLCLSSRRDRLLSSYSSGQILYHKIQSPIATSLQYHKKAVRSLTWIEGEENMFASGSEDTIVYIWDLRKEGPIHRLDPEQGKIAAVQSIAARSFASGGQIGPLKVWDLRILKYFSYKEPCSSICLLRGAVQHPSIKVISCSTDGNVILWSHQGMFLHYHESKVMSLSYHQGTSLYMSSEIENQKIIFWSPSIYGQ